MSEIEVLFADRRHTGTGWGEGHARFPADVDTSEDGLRARVAEALGAYPHDVYVLAWAEVA